MEATHADEGDADGASVNSNEQQQQQHQAKTPSSKRPRPDWEDDGKQAGSKQTAKKSAKKEVDKGEECDGAKSEEASIVELKGFHKGKAMTAMQYYEAVLERLEKQRSSDADTSDDNINAEIEKFSQLLKTARQNAPASSAEIIEAGQDLSKNMPEWLKEFDNNKAFESGSLIRGKKSVRIYYLQLHEKLLEHIANQKRILDEGTTKGRAKRLKRMEQLEHDLAIVRLKYFRLSSGGGATAEESGDEDEDHGDNVTVVEDIIQQEQEDEDEDQDNEADLLPERTMKQPMFQKTFDYEEFEPEQVTSDVGKNIRSMLRGHTTPRKVAASKNAADGAAADELTPTKLSENFLSVEEFDPRREGNKTSGKNAAGQSDDAADDDKSRPKVPWMLVKLGRTPLRNQRVPGLLQLHNEILRFIKLIDTTTFETSARQNDVDTLRELTSELFPGSDIGIFGSFANDLCIPNSDVDMTLFHAPTNAIFKLSKALKSRDMVRSIETISTARVPIIKMYLKDSPSQVDISFDQPGGIETGRMIRKLIQEMPALRPLVLTVKYFLAQRDINETYRGGIGSHLCLCMIVSMLQQFRRRLLFTKTRSDDRVEDLEDLGTLLLEFLDLYGQRFNYAKVAISLRDGGMYRTKDVSPEGRRPGILSLENPEDLEQDLGSSSYNIPKIRKAFAHAHRILVGKLDEYEKGNTDTVLDGIIIPTSELWKRFETFKQNNPKLV